jgi:BASS family bile acid:Na+ symporter
MQEKIRLKNIRAYMMPVSMLTGILFHSQLGCLSVITQYLIFVMLLISYANISLREVRISRLHLYMLSVQLFGSVLVYLALRSFNTIVAEGAMICILAPTATSAVVITGMLGGNTASLTAYSLLSNLSVAIAAPIFFSLLSNNPQLSFWGEFLQIGRQVFVLLLLPFVISILIDKFAPKVHRKIKSSQIASFILWNVALIIVTARTVNYLLEEGSRHFGTAFALFFVTMIICFLQFFIGRRLGRKFNDTIAGGQGLGQKNTILSIWMAQTYLNPISSIGSGAYILWQNIVNSYQVWRKGR